MNAIGRIILQLNYEGRINALMAFGLAILCYLVYQLNMK